MYVSLYDFMFPDIYHVSSSSKHFKKAEILHIDVDWIWKLMYILQNVIEG